MCYVAHRGVVQPLHNTENLLLKNFQNFLVRKQQVPLKSKTSKGIKIPVEALYGDFPKTPHAFLQKVRGGVDGFTKLWKRNQLGKNTLFLLGSQGEFASLIKRGVGSEAT